MSEENIAKHECARCKKEVSDAEFKLYEGDEKNVPVCYCDECANALRTEYEEETKNVNIWGALLLGLGAGILSGIIWYWIIVLTHTYFDIIVIGIAFLIAIAVIVGAGGKKGLKLQFLSAFLTLATVLIAEGFIGYQTIGAEQGFGLIQYLQSEGNTAFVANLILLPVIGLFSLGFVGFICLLISLYVAFVIPAKNKLKLFKNAK